MTGPSSHQLQVAATLDCLDRIHRFLGEVWTASPHVAYDERVRTTLATAELAANVIQHGSGDDAPPPTITLTIEVVGPEVRALLTDDGAPPPCRVPSPWTFDNLHDVPPVLRESGRGLHLVRTSADALMYHRDRNENHWTFNVRPRG